MTRIFNIYGITEVSCWATCHEVTPITTNNSAVGDIIPIGERLMDTCVKLRDQTETDNGIEGTLWIGLFIIIVFIEMLSNYFHCTSTISFFLFFFLVNYCHPLRRI